MENQEAKPNPSAGSGASRRRKTVDEGIPDGWVRVVVLISPDGQQVVGIGGDYQPPHDRPCPDFPQNWQRLQNNLAALRRIGDLSAPYPKPIGEGQHPIGGRRL